ncbi:MAG TPA: carbon starvation CstA 5TM domain-containing protein, partial [Opitutales bacterium]|nr:carbon starvation CstA 5TM domain-containing protein [Opitutales bacterium]
ALVLVSFLLTSTDTAARLGRYMLEEIVETPETTTQSVAANRYFSTGVQVALAYLLVTSGRWEDLWPLFGGANQLLAALALITFVVFLKHRRVPFAFALAPAALMVVMPITALVFMVLQHGPLSLLGGISLGMLLIGLYVTVMSMRFVLKSDQKAMSASKV